MNKYFYIDEAGAQQGPLEINLLKGVIKQDTKVWCTGMPDWVSAGKIAELNFLFQLGDQDKDPSCQQSPQPSYNQQTQQPYEQHGYNRSIPKTWFVESILVTVFCCIPFGIIGVINANKVESLYYAGDFEGSLKASKDAGKWTKIGFFAAIALWICYTLFYTVSWLLVH